MFIAFWRLIRAIPGSTQCFDVILNEIEGLTNGGEVGAGYCLNRLRCAGAGIRLVRLAAVAPLNAPRVGPWVPA